MKILYIVDAINHIGGANLATANVLAKLLEKGISVDVLTDSLPNPITAYRFKGIKIIHMPLCRWNFAWIARGAWRRVLHLPLCPDWMVDPTGEIRNLMASYDCVCVMSELSRFRGLVGHLPCKVRKVQLIHSDYVGMRNADKNAKMSCRQDRWIYRNMDVIGVIGRCNAQKMLEMCPQFAGKITWFYNYIPETPFHANLNIDKGMIRIVSAFSFDSMAKDPARVVRIAMRLVRATNIVDWTFVGDGSMRASCETAVAREGLKQNIHFLGAVKKTQKIFAESDILVLASHYEGLPMVIYESLMTGVPVLSTNVGGIPEQISNGENGWLVNDDEELIFDKLLYIVQNPVIVIEAKKRLLSYKYDNGCAIRKHLEMLGVHGGRR